MGRSDKMSMPSSGAGITRYFDDYRSKIEFKPGHIIVLVCIVIVIELILHSMGASWFGLS
jgi:preprotein translocase subunit Sec61beta